MLSQKPFCVTFAGAVGSSKTPIATYLSWNLGLPVFNNDAIRSEIAEDLGSCPLDEYIKRRLERTPKLLAYNRSFIHDASVDREWDRLKEVLDGAGYDVFVISLDLSRELLEKLYLAKGYHESLERLDQLMADHATFLDRYQSVVGCTITDETFSHRLEMAREEVEKWIAHRA